MNNIDSQSFIAGQPGNNPESLNVNTPKDAKNIYSSSKNKNVVQEKQLFLNLVLGATSKSDGGKNLGKFTESVRQSGSVPTAFAQPEKIFIAAAGKNNLSTSGGFVEEGALIKKGIANSAKQAMGSKEKKLDVELCAFSTYKLSYIDKLSDKIITSKNISTEKNYSSTLYANDINTSTSYPSLSNGVKFGVAAQEVSTKYLEDIDLADNPTKAATAEHLMQYEKYKISLVGEEQKTLIIRDYGNNLELDGGDIKKLFANHPEKLSTVILNGKEI